MPRVELPIEHIVRTLRKKKYPCILKAYETDTKTCPHCNGTLKNLCTNECLTAVVKKMLNSDELRDVIPEIAAIYAKKKGLANGQTIHYSDNHYRNNKLLFWDAQNEVCIYPFGEIDDYGSVPPIFPVGDGYFNPTDWVDEVDHNTYVFPAKPLMNEMKTFAAENPGQRMIVTINMVKYTVYYDEEIDWDSCVLEVDPLLMISGDKGTYSLQVHAGDPEWRKDIVDEQDEDSTPKPRILSYEPDRLNLIMNTLEYFHKIKTQIQSIQAELQNLLERMPKA